MEPILRTENLTICFGGHTAVDQVNFNMPEKKFKINYWTKWSWKNNLL